MTRLGVLVAGALLQGCYCKASSWSVSEDQQGTVVLSDGGDLTLDVSSTVTVVGAHDPDLHLTLDITLGPQLESDTGETGGPHSLVFLTVESGAGLLYERELDCSQVGVRRELGLASLRSLPEGVAEANLTMRAEHREGSACVLDWDAKAWLRGPDCCSDWCFEPPDGTAMELTVSSH